MRNKLISYVICTKWYCEENHLCAGQGWFSSGRNLFLPEDSEECGNKYFFRGFFHFFRKKWKKYGNNYFFHGKKIQKHKSLKLSLQILLFTQLIAIRHILNDWKYAWYFYTFKSETYIGQYTFLNNLISYSIICLSNNSFIYKHPLIYIQQ